MTRGKPTAGDTASRPSGPGHPRLQELDAEYEILGELGRGGTAIVLRALEREFGREVAIKVVRPTHLDDSEAAARLAREAKMVALLRHPNIVTLFGTRHLADGGLALIMQYVPGRTLKQAVREDGPMPVAAVRTVLRQVASALDYAHRRHAIVHRDIKPDNIYLDQEHGHAMLSDFGIARAGEPESTLTLAGVALGTPAYMSPEQIDGGALDGRSDLYSLGLVAYEMLTGRQPWEGSNLYGIIYKQKNEELPPLNDARPDLPAYLQRAIEGLLRKDRAQRWTDAAQFLAQLRPNAPPPRRTPSSRSPAPRPAEPVYDDSPTIRYRRDDVEAGGPEPEGAATADAGRTPAAANVALPADVLAAIAAQQPPRPTRSRGRSWRSLSRVAFILLVGAAAATVAMIREPGEAPPGMGEQPFGAANVRPSTVPPATTPGRIVPLAGDGQQARAGTVLPAALEVRVEDRAGRPLAGVQVEFHVLAGAGSISPAAALTDSLGVALARWTLGRVPGLNEVVARVAGAPDAPASFLAMGLVGPPARIVVAEGSNQEVPRGETLPREIVVGIEDAQGNPLDGVPVEFSVTSGGGSVSPAAARAEAGRARTAWTLGPAVGTQNLVAVVPGTQVRVTVAARARYRLTVIPTMAAGGTHTCTLDASGAIACWGGNENGQLGTGHAGRNSGLAVVHTSTSFARLATGVSHSCALDRDGTALCWGSNAEGQLGTGDRNDRHAPVPVRGVQRFSTLAAGVAHTCALDDAGAAFCWGAGSSGQVGDGTGNRRTAPVAVTGGPTFTTLSAGWSHTCGLTTQQIVYCWGENREGQLGDGTTADRAAPTRIAGDLRFVSISAGATHTCGITTDGEAYCWGERPGAAAASRDGSRPVRIDAPVRFASTVAGAVHNCALARTGEAYCWGRNNFGQLGNGGAQDSQGPAPVVGGIRFVSLTASGSHTCGRSLAGQDFCWGYNMDGQLGDASRTERRQPVRVV